MPTLRHVNHVIHEPFETWFRPGESSLKSVWVCGEIDIMEFVGFDPNTVHANAHCKKYNHIDKTGQSGKLQVENLTVGFHVFAIEWFPDRIDFYFDDEKYHTFSNDGTGHDAWPFDRPHYLLLNLAIGGAWGGKEGVDNSIFPQQYLIDYVRVYQQAE
ncbi:MAG: glycoside hydrolase family 16 protein [Bythopirellula sp.]